MLTNKTPLSQATLEALPDLKYIGVLATGHNVVDSIAAHAHGIPVTNVPSAGLATRALLLGFPQIELSGNTLGIISLDTIGLATAKIAQALGMKILANRKSKNPCPRALKGIARSNFRTERFHQPPLSTD